MNIVINPAFNHLKEYINSISSSFVSEKNIIYEGRNTLKLFNAGGRQLVVKSFKIPHFINKIAYSYLRPSKARRSYEYGLEIIKRGINTPTPVAYIEEYKYGLLNRSFYVSEYCDYDRSFREFTYYKESFEGKDDILIAFADFTAQMHRASIYHKDYSPGNILFKKNDGEIEFCIVDINRIRFGVVTEKLGYKNFERIWAGDDMLTTIAKRYAFNCGFKEEESIKKIFHYNHIVMVPPISSNKSK